MKKASALLGSLLFSVGLLAVSGQAVKADTVQPAQTTATEQVQTTQTTAEQTATDQTTDQVATNAPAVSQQSTTQINYVKGYGVNLWQLNADQSVSWTGRRLTTGTKWKTFGYTDLSKSQQRVYNLGGNQWIYAQYLVDAGTKQKVAGYQAASSQTKPSGQTPAQTTDITPAANGTVGIVGYRPSYGTVLYSLNGNTATPTGRFLKNGTAWKIVGSKTINGTTYYNLGGNQWVNAAYIVTGNANGAYRVLKSNPSSREYYTSQYNPVFAPWGCASSALSMLMKYDGNWKNVPGNSEKAKLTYMQNHLPRNKANGGQDGDPYTGRGFSRVILSYRLTQYAHSLGDAKIVDVSGVSLSGIIDLIKGGKPVLYYGWSSYQAGGARNHCKVIFGYNAHNNTFLVHDPLYQYKYFYRGGGGMREGVRNGYDLGPIAWVSARTIAREYAGNALTIH
ncbi:MAG: C39 family peptidase [Lactobacillus sp.]|nr:C39 family peptidase [Lactobacillus sp.]MCH3906185.1 C39 family peptidase [Lactobacillus sp.]MCI1883342.1 C39 family peptidase [Lactobacillus sp.]MCI1916066.1 C39 family peptidase [Lactobacillus sp.]MCI1942534.1 C39 family peptidase [Lactobacillus sp.]